MRLGANGELALLANFVSSNDFAMPRQPKKSQPSRSSLRVAQARSLSSIQTGDGSDRSEVVAKRGRSKAKRRSPSVSTGRSLSPKQHDASSVPRLDRPWVMYDLAGKSFVVNPMGPGTVGSSCFSPYW